MIYRLNKGICKNCGEEIIWDEDRNKWFHDFSGSIVCENKKSHAEPEDKEVMK